MAKPLFVSKAKWNDAIILLKGWGVGPNLSNSDQRRLRESLRGPFADGMTEQQAIRVLRESLGWEKDDR